MRLIQPTDIHCTCTLSCKIASASDQYSQVKRNALPKSTKIFQGLRSVLKIIELCSLLGFSVGYHIFTQSFINFCLVVFFSFSLHRQKSTQTHNRGVTVWGAGMLWAILSSIASYYTLTIAHPTFKVVTWMPLPQSSNPAAACDRRVW